MMARKLGGHLGGQRLRPVGLEQAAGFGARALVERRRAGGDPLLADPAVDELRARLAAHVAVGVVVREEVAERADLGDDVDRQGLVVDRRCRGTQNLIMRANSASMTSCP